MSAFPDPRPQGQPPRTFSGINQPAAVGTYVDPALTVQNGQTASPPTPVPPRSGSTTLGSTRTTYAEDGNTEIEKDAAIDNSAAQDIPRSPNSWAIKNDDQGIPRSADPYSATTGLIGRDYLKNAGEV